MPEVSPRGPKEWLSAVGSRLSSALDRYYASAPPYRLNAWDKLTGLAVFVFFFSLYLYTCSHGPNPAGDSPELIAGSYSLGILHPPGYPLYTLIGYLFARLPIGSIAFRVNFTSVIFHSLTLLVFFVCAMKMTRSRAASSIAAAALGFSGVFWFYAQVAEVFPLNNLFIALLIYVAIRSREEWLRDNVRGSLRRIVLLAFLAGLSLSHHHTILLIFPALMLILPRQLVSVLKKPSLSGACLLSFLAGLLPYMYLPIRASQEPYLNFLNPSTFQRFIHAVTRKYYGSTRLWIGPAADHRIDMVFLFLKGIYEQVRLLGLILGFTGVFYAKRKRFGDFLPLFAALISTAVAFPVLANVKVQNVFFASTLERFFIAPTIIFSFFIALGLSAFINKLRDSLAALSVRDDLRRGLLWALSLVMAALLFLPASSTASAVNLRYDAMGEAYIRNLTASLDEGSVLFVAGDVPIFLMEYCKVLKTDPKDIAVLVFSFLGQPWYFSHIEKYYPHIKLPTEDEIRADRLINPDKGTSVLVMERIIRDNPHVSGFYTVHTPELDESLEFQPRGLAFKIVPREAGLDLSRYFHDALAYYGKLDMRGLSAGFYAMNRRELDLVSQVALYPYETGKYLANKGYGEEALIFFSYAYQLDPAPEILKKMADTYRELGAETGSYQCLDLYLNSGGTSTQGVWEALMDLEDLMAGGLKSDAR